METTLTSKLTSFTKNTVTLVPRVTIQWPARMDVVDYFHRTANLFEGRDEEMNWDHTHTYLLPLTNDFCLKKMAKNAIDMFENEIHYNGKVLKVEFFDPQTHKLVMEATA